MVSSDFLNLQPGSTVVYHRGFLALDRDVEGGLTDTERRLVNRAANTARALAEAGKVVLVQRRLGPGKFEYLAKRTAA